MSVITAAMVAATLDLPINQSLGFAHIVPYKGKASFQIGWKGIVQLAIRSGQYARINATQVYNGEIIAHNPFTGDMELRANPKSQGDPVGYLLYFRLMSGYEKYVYMTREEILAHAEKYSQGFKSSYSSPWKDNFDAMALKTVVKLGLSKWGVLSIEMQKAVVSDEAVVDENGEALQYPDNEPTPESPAATQAAKQSRLKTVVASVKQGTPTPAPETPDDGPFPFESEGPPGPKPPPIESPL